MYCSHLSLTNFRNYLRLELALSPGVTVVVGDNAQGKSNLLEALYLLATTKSFRATSDRELISWVVGGSEFAYTRLVAQVAGTRTHPKVELVIREEARPTDAPDGGVAPAVAKRIKLNDIPRRAIDVVGTVNVVLFAPQDIELIEGAPALRRRYLDITLSQANPRYCRTLAHYNRVLLHRNHLLRQVREHRARPDQLHFWDQELTQAGTFIVQERLSTLGALSDLAAAVHRRLTGRQECLHVGYRSSLDALGATDGGEKGAVTADALGERFGTAINRSREREIGAGFSLFGPHRDDLMFLVDERDMNVYGSRGQQRTVALALKLAEAEFLAQRAGEPPILLLDDVMSELDQHRRDRIRETIEAGQQVIFTTTHLGAFTPDFLREATLLRVEQGAISPLLAGTGTP